MYLAVARCALALQAPAPLSPADLAAWGGGERTRDLALMRRIRSLTDAGWLIAEPGRAVKLRLRPSWGQDADGVAQPWQLDDAQLGKPEGLRVRRVPLELLDSYLGRIDPQPGRRPALVTRYFDRPLLGFADLGVYAITQITAIAPTAPLLALGLLDAAGPQPPPPLADLLIAASAGQLHLGDGTGDSTSDGTSGSTSDGTVALSLQGRYRLDARNGSSSGSLSRSSNGSCSGSHDHTPDLGPSGASERDESPARNFAAAAAWDGWDRSTEGHESPTPSVADTTRAGGRVIHLSLIHI